MTTLALEIHDAGLLAVCDDPERTPLPASPGVALLEGDGPGRLLVGREAMARARLKPRWVHHRFWHQLDTTPLPRPFPRDLTAADLAHAHLTELWKAAGEGVESVLLAVPGSFGERQLGLTLGIARASGMPVEGLADSAVAAAAAWAPAGNGPQKVLHLDLHLHQAVLTELAVDSAVQRRRVRVEERVGAWALQDAWARRVARLLVHATRFDPLHSAASEQELYDRLPGWLEQLRERDAVEVTFSSAGRQIGVEMSRTDLLAAAEPFYGVLRRQVQTARRLGEPVTLLLAHRVAALPDLTARLAELRDLRVTELPEGAAAAGALAAREAVRRPGDELPFLTRLPAAGAEPETGAEAAGAGTAPRVLLPGPPPTHILHGAQAHPLGEEPLGLGTGVPEGTRNLTLVATPGAGGGISPLHCTLVHRQGRVILEDHSTWGTFLNGERVAGRVEVAAGDRLRLGSPGVELLLIRVAEAQPHEPSRESPSAGEPHAAA